MFMPCLRREIPRLPRHFTHEIRSARYMQVMNRPRNRQPRQRGPLRSQGPAPGASASAVPSVQQVIPGAVVSIVLKADQPTGRQVQGIVQDLLTRGNHPRGIKVRLQDGQVGRVQRMAAGSGASGVDTTFTTAAEDRPPQRSLADYMPALNGNKRAETTDATEPSLKSAIAKCPVCGLFEGDEAAVSRHVESHFT